MNVIDEEMARSLYNNEIPKRWLKMAPDTSMSLSCWLQNLQQRAQQYKLWSGSGEPTVMWLSGLHAPNTYIKAIIQTDCRKNLWPIENADLFTKVTQYSNVNQVEDRPEMVSDAYYVHAQPRDDKLRNSVV